MKVRLLGIIIIVALLVSPIGEQIILAQQTEDNTPKTKEERMRELQLERAEITLRQMKATMEEKKRDYESMNSLFKQKLVSVQELNDAKKDMDDAVLAYDRAKLDLQLEELSSLRAAWHITIKKAEVTDKGNQKSLKVILENTSERVKLERTKKMIQEKVIEPVATEVSPEINDIYVSIKEGDNIISNPYEIYIKSLKVGKEEPLEFTLIKDVEDVVVSMRYADQEERRNIHLKKLEPYISVEKALKYNTPKGERMLYVVLKNGAEEKAGEHVGIAVTPASQEKSSPIKPDVKYDAEADVLNDINNIYVSVKDEQMNTIGIPYEIRIPVLKYNDHKAFRFKLQKNVNSVVISMNYMKIEHSKTVFLEPDTRHISIIQAQVSKSEDSGKKMVTLELVNRSESGEIPFAEDLKEITGGSITDVGEIRNVFVSLKSDNNVIISQPYERVIPKMEYNKPERLTFTLQQPEVDSVTVSLSYLDRIEERNVYLEKVSLADIVAVTSIGFAQEGQLGRSVSYDLTLERLAEVEKIFKMRVINLPEQISYQFNDPEAGTRVTEIKFTHAQSRRELSLQLFLPEEMDLSLLDKPIEFYAAVLSEEEDKNHDSGKLSLSQEQLDQMKAGKVKLVLTPKGTPEFELIAQSLYFEKKTGESVEMMLTLKNNGTRHLNDIRITADLPSNRWSADITPNLVGSLDRNEEKDINVKISPPEDVGVGDMEVKIKAECEVDNVKITAPDKNVRIHMAGKTNIIGTTILIGALVLLVVGIAVLTIRLSRR